MKDLIPPLPRPRPLPPRECALGCPTREHLRCLAFGLGLIAFLVVVILYCALRDWISRGAS